MAFFFFLIFPRKSTWTVHGYCLYNLYEMLMSLYWEKYVKNIPKCCVLKFLPSMPSVAINFVMHNGHNRVFFLPKLYSI